MRRFGSRVLVSLMLVMLAGFAASCGEEESGSGAQESAERATTTAAAESSTRAEDTDAEEAAEPEETTAASAAEEPANDEEEAAAPEDEAYQYEEEYGYQYESEEDSSAQASSEQYDESEAPADPTMYLSVPKLGISGALVIDGEAGLEAGAMHLAGTGYPWQSGANTYIAGHRVGFPGTGSDRIFYDLPVMAQGDEVILEDSNGQAYTYAVSEIFAVTPADVWVTAPTGSDMVTLQVCTETPEDWFTIGPRLMESGPDSGRLIVRAERVA